MGEKLLTEVGRCLPSHGRNRIAGSGTVVSTLVQLSVRLLMSDRPEVHGTPPSGGMRWISAGTFQMGDDNAYPEEGPAHTVSVGGFWIDECPVTNADFAAFVAETDYLTVAERPLDPATYPGAEPKLLKPAARFSSCLLAP